MTKRIEVNMSTPKGEQQSPIPVRNLDPDIYHRAANTKRRNKITMEGNKMAKLTNFKDMVNLALGDVYRTLGFHLDEPDDHALNLYHQGVLVAVFSATAATVSMLHTACREHLSMLSALAKMNNRN